MSITGEEGGEPCRVGASIGDIGASLFGAVGIMAALQKRQRTGKGTRLDVAMLDCQLALMENAVARCATLGLEPRALGSRHPLVVPFQAFPTADRPLAVCVDTDAQWQRLCAVLGCPELLADPRFARGNDRGAHHGELEPLLKSAFARHGRDHWLTLLEAADVPASPINSVSEDWPIRRCATAPWCRKPRRVRGGVSSACRSMSTARHRRRSVRRRSLASRAMGCLRPWVTTARRSRRCAATA